MSNKNNCPNCGAPIEVAASQCPYCGTSYFDFSNIELNSNQPIYLKLKHGNDTIVMPVICTSYSITQEASGYLYSDNRRLRIRSNNYTVDMSFESVYLQT